MTKRDASGKFTKKSKRKGGKPSRWRRHKARRIPILPLAGAAVGLTQRSMDGAWASPLEAIQSSPGDIPYLIQTLASSYAGLQLPIAGGYKSGPVKFDVWRTINIFDLGYAPGLKYTIWGGIASIALKALGITKRVQPYMQKIPIVRKFTL